MTDGENETVTGYVLAGGRSSRMGQDKALMWVDGEPLVEHALRRLRQVCSDAGILSGPPDFERDALLSCYGRLISDRASEHAGPLAGLVAAIQDCRTRYVLLLAADQPAITPALLQTLVQAGSAGQATAVCLAQEGRPEPLPLLVSRDLGPGLERALASGERRLLPTVQACAAAFGSELVQVPVPPADAGCFLNLNTPADLFRWQAQRSRSNHSAAAASERTDG